MKKLMIILIVSASPFLASAGGGWPQKKGSGYFKLNQYVLRADKYFNPEGNRIDVLPTISYYSTSLYGEYGLTDNITVIAFIPFFNRLTLNELVRLDGTVVAGDELNSFGDTDLTLKYGLGKINSWSFAANLTLGLPLGNPSGGNTNTLQSGDGEFNQMISLDAGFSAPDSPFYFNATLGFNNRTENLSDEIRYALEAGINATKRLLVLGRLQSVHSLRNGSTDPSAIQGLFSNNIEYMILSPEINWSFTNAIGISTSVSIPISGNQVLGNAAYNLGLFWKLSGN